TPMQEVMVAVKLTRPPAEGNVLMNGAKSLGRLGSKAGSLAARTLQWGSRRGAAAQALPAEADYGCLYLKLMSITHKVSDKLKGVLTVHLIRCVNLLGDNPNTYVRMLVTDEETDQVQKSQLVYSQSSPRWGDKFDFVMVTAGSSLHLTVFDKASLASSLMSSVNVFSKKKKEEESDLVLGKLQIPVRDVVRNGQLQDTFTLQDAERGQIQLGLTWQTCYLSDSA
ncbi:C2 domain-containing protein, partial [Haematococcus lacustris]